MNLTQKVIFAMLMVLLTGILVLSHVPVDNLAAKGVAKYALIATIFTASLFATKPTRIHKILGLAIIFLFIGDFFLVFLWNVLSNFSDILLIVKICGMAGFLSGYVCLIWVYTRRFSFAIKDILAAIPVLAVVIPVLIILVPRVSGAFLIFALVFALVVSFMAWSAICTLRRGYYSKKVAVRFALAGFLMFLSDMGVAFIMFYPGMENFPWLENEVWITYIPAWTLILITTYEDNLLKENTK
jgi:hypothetical protein